MVLVHFEVIVSASGGAQLGAVGLTIYDEPENVFHSSNTYMSNGTYLNKDKTIASWTYNIAAKLEGLGSNDFYPYDSWLFSVTLSSPFLSSDEINSTNTYMKFQNFLTDWGHDCPYGCFVPSYQNSMVTTFVLSRPPGGAFVPAAYVPWILWFILGIAVLIPPDDLATKSTLYTSIIFFLGGLLFTRVLSFQSSGSSYVENSLYYVLFLTSIYLLEAIFEKLLGSRGQTPRKNILRIVLELGFIIGAFELLSRQYVTFSELLMTYWWVTFPIIQTLYIPVFLLSWATVVNVCLILVGMMRLRREHPDSKQQRQAIPESSTIA
jgi:hypothetical protein